MKTQPTSIVNPNQPNRLIKIGEVLSLIPVSKATWYEGIRTGRFPKPVKLGMRASAWKLSEINTLIDSMNGGVA